MNRDSQRQVRLFIFAVVIIFAIVRSCQRQTQPPPQRTERTPAPRRTPSAKRTPRPGRDAGQPLVLRPRNADNSNLLLGMPAPASQNPENFLVERAQYALSYNSAEGGPNWVSWHLEAANLGDEPRGKFRPDPMLPDPWQIRPNDYRGSGYDRGHVCPSGDRTATEEDNDATFMMSNMLPQTAALNQHVWKDLEDYCRDLAKDGNELYIVAGGISSVKRIGRSKINVPAQCWKIALVLPEGDNDLSRIDANTRIIAVLMPNQENKQVEKAQWSQYATSVAQIEKATGYDFFPNVPVNVRRKLLAKVDAGRS